MTLSNFFQAALWQISAISPWSLLLLKATLILAIAWFGHFVLAKANPRWRVLLWRGTGVGLAFLAVWFFALPGLKVRVGAIALRPVAVAPCDKSQTAAPAPTIPTRCQFASDEILAPAPPAPALESDHLEACGETECSNAVSPDIIRADTPAPPLELSAGSQRWSWSSRSVFWTVWALGAMLMVIRLVIGYRRFAGLLGSLQPAPETVVAEVAKIAASLGCRRNVRVRRSCQFAVPFLCGLRRPVLVLPERMCEPAWRDHLSAILAHELTHVRAHDFGWNAALQAVSILLWFHPLVWRIGSAHRAACDAVCDAVSAGYLGDVQRYCRTLAQIALESTRAFPAVGLAMARCCDVRHRIAMLQHRVYAVGPRPKTVVGVGLFGLLALVLLAGVRFASAESPAETAENTAAPETQSVPPADDAHDSDVAKAPPKQADSSSTAETTAFAVRPMRIRVVDQEGKPIPYAEVTTSAVIRRNLYHTDDVTVNTNADGVATIDVPREDVYRFEITARAGGFVTYQAAWQERGVPEAVPEEFEFQLEPGTMMGGVVRDERGQPIGRAEISFRARLDCFRKRSLPQLDDKVETDAQGQWTSRRVPKNLDQFAVPRVLVRHPNYASPMEFDLTTETAEALRTQSAVWVMQQGIAVAGTVCDLQGQPIINAKVGLFTTTWPRKLSETTTDPQGHYTLPPCKADEYFVVAAAPGHAPDARLLKVTPDHPTVEFQLDGKSNIRLRVVDQEGNPLVGTVLQVTSCSATLPELSDDDAEPAKDTAGALPTKTAEVAASAQKVKQLLSALTGARDSRLDAALALACACPAHHFATDAEGRWVWPWMAGTRLTLTVTKSGYEQVERKVAPSEQEQVITLVRGGWSVAGRVVDQDTKTPLARFDVVEGDSESARTSWRDKQTVENANGEYRLEWAVPNPKRAIRIEAEGYLPSELRRLPKSERDATFDVELKKGEGIFGTVRGVDGKPLGGVEVILVGAGSLLGLQNGRPLLNPFDHSLAASTDAEGRFSFQAQDKPCGFVVTCDQGYAESQSKKGGTDIRIQPWCRIEGTLRIGNRPGANETIDLDTNLVLQWGITRKAPEVLKNILGSYKTQTDAKGRFVFDRVRPGMKAVLIHRAKLVESGADGNRIHTQCTMVDCAPGKRLNVNLGGAGRPVTGRLLLPNDKVPESEFADMLVTAERLLLDIPWPKKYEDWPKNLAAMPKNAWNESIQFQQMRWWDLMRWQGEWLNSRRSAKYQGNRTLQIQGGIQQDGAFRLEDLPPGAYRISINNVFWNPKKAPGQLSYVFLVPEMPDGRSEDALDLGDLKLAKRDDP